MRIFKLHFGLVYGSVIYDVRFMHNAFKRFRNYSNAIA